MQYRVRISGPKLAIVTQPTGQHAPIPVGRCPRIDSLRIAAEGSMGKRAEARAELDRIDERKMTISAYRDMLLSARKRWSEP